MVEHSRPHPSSGGPIPLPVPGLGGAQSFTTLEALMTHYSRWLPAQYVWNVVEAEKEVFVVRRECSLQETHMQFLRKCESALMRSLAEVQAGRSGWDWNYVAPPAP
jgi:hypothetical protein